VLGYSPYPSFALARWCFYAAGLVLALAISFTAFNVAAAPLAIRLAISALGVAVSGCIVLAAVIWVSWRQSEFTASKSSALGTQHAVPSVTTTTTNQAAAVPVTSTGATTSDVPKETRDDPTESVADSDPSAPGSRQNPFVTADVRKIIKPYRTRTAFEAEPLTKRYLGRWLKVDALVFNLRKATYDEHEFNVTTYLNDGPATDIFVLMTFDDRTVPAVRVLDRDDRIVAICKIEKIGINEVTLTDCELISP
jgi:hypothetical protein